MRKLTAKNYSISDFNAFIYNEDGSTIEGKEKIDENIGIISTQLARYQTNQLRLENLTPATYSINSKAACDRLTNAQRNNELYCCLYKLYDSGSKHSKAFKKLIKVYIRYQMSLL